VRLQLQWTPQAQFVGFYVAEAKNFYAEEGLDIEFSHGGPDINPIQRLVTQQVDIGLAPGDQVLVWQSNHQSENVSLKAVGTVFKRNIAVFMSRRGQGISTPQALKGKKVGVYPSHDTENVLLCMLKKHGVNPSELEIRAFPDLKEFLSAKATAVDVFPAYLINEPLLAEQSGVAVDLIDPEQFGVKFYSDTIIATGAYLAQNRDVVKKFLRASARGWDFSRSNPAEALKLMYRVVGPSVGKGEPEKHQERMLRTALDYVGVGPEKRMFEMEKSRWEEMSKSLSEIGRVQTKEVYVEVCDFKIIDEASQK
jgi:ABC-type nitrate/sulfonate/bicarbonate transport system substrate-binding protein